MKLYIYAIATKQKPESATDFGPPKKEELIGSWCNHPGLYDFLERCYERNSGAKELFRNTTLQLSIDDIYTLSGMVYVGELPRTSDWLFGDADSCTKQSYEMFIERAIKAFDKGKYVFVRVI